MKPYFSICIPQYNRTEFLIRACKTFSGQTLKDFEICISDDCSTDGKEGFLIEFLEQSGLCYTYRRDTSNRRYDGNLRSAIEMSSGRYLLLMGNDDGLAAANTLELLQSELEKAGNIAAAITNYHEVSTGVTFQRMARTGLVGAGPSVAAEMFRNYSFVSGIVLDGEAARREASDICDGSEMYQMYLGTRLVAAGGRLLAVASICIDKDLQIPNWQVDSYRLKPKLDPCPIVTRHLPLGRLMQVVAAGLEPYHKGRDRERRLVRVARQLYLITFPFWIIEYRRVQSWRYALGILLGLKPRYVAGGLCLSRLAMVRLWIMYLTSGAAALMMPIGVFDGLRPLLYRLAKRTRAA